MIFSTCLPFKNILPLGTVTIVTVRAEDCITMKLWPIQWKYSFQWSEG